MIGWVASMSSCSVTKYVPEDQLILRRNKIKLNSDKILNDKGELKDLMNSITVQKPNTYLFGAIPYKVWLYNFRHKKYEKDVENFQIESKTVEAPVILDTAAIALSKKNMAAHLFNAGYFHNEVESEITTKGQRATVNYNINTGSRFVIKEQHFDIPDSTINEIVRSHQENSLLKPGAFYSNTDAGEERNRLVSILKDQGYYDFGAEEITFELDTMLTTMNTSDNLAGSIIDLLLSRTQNTFEIKVKTIIENNLDSTAFLKSRIGNVVVYMNMTDTMRLGRLFQIANNPIIQDELQIIYNSDDYIKKDVLNRSIKIRPNSLFSISDYNRTIRLLTDLNVFQYTRVRYVQSKDSLGNPIVHAVILLSPNKKYDFNYNVEVSGGDIYIFGVATNASITNKNLFKAANQLTTTVSYGLALESDNNRGLKLFSQTFGLNTGLTVPRFWLLNPELFGSNIGTRTIINAGANFMDRSAFFNLRNINSSIIYQLNKNKNLSFNFKPAFVNILNLSNISPEFQTRMDTIPAIKNAYQQTFIQGEGAEVIWSINNVEQRQRRYLRLNFEEAGLLLSGISLVRPIKNYAEYVRLDFDARQYFDRNLSSLIFRFHGGIGMPYGNSTTLPYIKQYFVGGAYSIRGWRPRVLGPGGYRDPDLADGATNIFIDQAGDIKLEFNAEYRFTITRLFSNAISLNGAVFTDMGNIWLAKEDYKLPNAEFRIQRLYQDVAISSGAGFRIDFGGFLVLRLDYALQMKKPYVADNYGWTIQHMSLGSKEWRKNNATLNIAIGYPF